MADYIFGIAHIKAGIQYLTGNEEGAKQTIRNNFTKGIGVSYINAGVAKLLGDDEVAKECWNGANQTTSGVVNSIPVVGHVKGVVHLACGDEKGAEEAFIASTRSTAVMGAGAVGLLGGPVAAVAAGTAAGTAWDVSTAVVTDGKQAPGLAKALIEPEKWENWLDAGICVAGDGLAGYNGYKCAKAVKNMAAAPERGAGKVNQVAAEQAGAAAEQAAAAAEQLVQDYNNGHITFEQYNQKWAEIKKQHLPDVKPDLKGKVQIDVAERAARGVNVSSRSRSPHFTTINAQMGQQRQRQRETDRQRHEDREENHQSSDEDEERERERDEKGTEYGRAVLKSLRKLLEKIRASMRKGQTSFHLYLELELLLELLICNYNAEFVSRTANELVLSIGPDAADQIVFDRELQDFCNELARQQERDPLSLDQLDELESIIYRIYCQDHEFSYVGQTINGAEARGNSHYSSMSRADFWYWRFGTTNQNEMADHARQFHPHETLEETYQMEVLRHLPEHNGRNPQHRRVRRAWEMFYQWVYKAWKGYGGGSRR